MKNKVLSFSALVLLGIFFLADNAFALPSEWGVVNPTDMVTTNSEMLDVMEDYWQTDYTEPAFFIWVNDEGLTSWNIAWTGGGGDPTEDHGGTDTFLVEIQLENAATGEFATISWDDSDQVLVENTGWNGNVNTFAHAWDYFDGIGFEITDWASPSYVGFDLNINGSAADPNYIFFGASMQSVASLGIQDEDFSVAAPVPEPGTMVLLGVGLIGLAGLQRKKFKTAKNR